MIKEIERVVIELIVIMFFILGVVFLVIIISKDIEIQLRTSIECQHVCVEHQDEPYF
jgi:hypothetical protein